MSSVYDSLRFHDPGIQQERLSDGGASVEGEGHRYRPWGFRGGREGQPAELRLERADGSVVPLPSKVPHTQVKTGD